MHICEDFRALYISSKLERESVQRKNKGQQRKATKMGVMHPPPLVYLSVHSVTFLHQKEALSLILGYKDSRFPHCATRKESQTLASVKPINAAIWTKWFVTRAVTPRRVFGIPSLANKETKPFIRSVVSDCSAIGLEVIFNEIFG